MQELWRNRRSRKQVINEPTADQRERSIIILLFRRDRSRNLVRFEVMYIERCLQYRHSVAIFNERRVHWLIDAFFFLLFRRLQNQKLAHVIQFFLHSDTHCSSPVCSSAFTSRLTRHDVSSINSSHRSNDSHRGEVALKTFDAPNN